MVKNRLSTQIDGGYGWVIVFSSFLSHFILIGIVRSYGVLYVAFLRVYGESATKTAALASCFNTVRMLLAPLISALCKRTSCRLSMIVGGIIMMAGLVISAYAPSLNFLFVSFGVIGGLGGALLFTPPYIIVGQYFNKKKGIAMSLGTVGSGLGSSVMAPAIVFFLHHYTYRGCMTLLGAITLHNCVAGALFRPFHEEKTDICEEMQVPKDTPFDEQNIELYAALSPEPCCQIEEDGITHVDNHYQIGASSKGNECAHSGNIKDQNNPMKNNMLKCLRLFVNSTMICYCLCILMMPVAQSMVVLFVADSAIIHGATDNEAALIMTFFGICDAIGRIGCGFIFDLKVVRFRRRVLFAILGILVGFSVAAVGLMSSYLGYLIMTCIFGLLAGGFHAQRITIVSEFIPKAQLSNTVGISIFCQGLGNLVGPLIGGVTRDQFGNYNLGFYIGGIGLSVANVLFVVDYLLKKPSAETI